jgi:LysM domain
MSFVPAFPATGRTILAFALGLLVPTAAFAQGTGGGGGGGGAPAGGGGGGGIPAGATQTGTVTTQGPTTITNYPGGVAPTPAGQNLGGGNAQFSSSKPITGNERDSFDLNRGGGGGTVRGGENSSFVLGGGEVRGGSTPGLHVVRKGDTLWGICGGYFQNPYQWPRIWSYNPQIQNPHWIYPGDQVRLRGGEMALPSATPSVATGPGIIDRRRQVPPDTIFLRTQGYIEDEKNTNWGEISGSPEDKMILTDLDEVYLRIASDKDVKLGQELTIYRPVKSIGGGKLIEIQGTAKVDQWNPKERIARARITETLDAIERGARVGPVSRRFEVVPPQRNEADVDTQIITSVHPHQMYGQHQVVFVDKGEEAGLKAGNRLFVLKKGDQWHQSFTNRSAVKRIALESDSPAATENVPRPRSDDALPEEFQAELRVISVKKKTAMCVVTDARREIENGDKAFLRKGF